MKIVHGDELPAGQRAPRGREGRQKSRLLLTGDPSRPDNFAFRIAQLADYRAPRHRHNFDQFYYVLDGEADFGGFGMVGAGGLGYVPEGAFYGPQSADAFTVISLQFGGPSGLGYLGYGQTTAAFEALKKDGDFIEGVYRRHRGVPGPANQDSYEAIWEHVRKRPVIYPRPQYATSIFMDTSVYPWAALPAPGVWERALGTFGSCKCRAAMYRLGCAATLEGTGRGIYHVLSGCGSVAGNAYRADTAIYLDVGESVEITADEPTEILLLGLPDASLMAKMPIAPPMENEVPASSNHQP